MFDKEKIDIFFQSSPVSSSPTGEARHTQKVKRTKLFLPSLAALLLGLLLAWPSLKNDIREITLDITRPKAGELEKLHVENTNFYITDNDNNVHNFIAQNIDEHDSDSKIIKLNILEGIINSSPTTWINIKSDVGFFNQDNNTLQLPNLIEIFYSDGMNAEVFDGLYDFKTSLITSSSPVTGEGNLGNIESEAFEMNTKTGVITFLGKTKIKLDEKNFKGTEK